MFRMRRFSIPLLLFLFTGEAAQNDLNVLKNNWLEYTDIGNFLYHHLCREAYRMLDERENSIARLQTGEDWKQRQVFIRQTLNDITGPFPEKTPLNARIVRTIDKGTYRVEHIIYESLPGFYVTSSLFLPSGLKKKNRAPAIIYVSGHSADGYRSSVYQHAILNLVNKGFVVFAFDPVGQGERIEYPDPVKGESSVGGPTKEHSYPGAQAFITGSSQAFYMIWDGIRAIDYLLTRKEVDPARIGITGRSGGGTQSAYIAAIDDRIYAAAPENYLTNYKRLLQTIGPQDAEQNMFNIISRGLDHPDFLIVRAPKPALMITTSNDMFSIQGVRETEREVRKVYEALGIPGNFYRVEDDAPHASTLKNREVMYGFFQKFLNNPGNPKDEDIPLLTNEELRVTPTGQVSSSLKSETVFSLNKRRAEDLEAALSKARQDQVSFLAETVRSAEKLSGYSAPALAGDPVFSGRVVRDNYVIEKYFIKGEGEYVIPYLMFRPAGAGNKFMIWLNPEGKSADAAKGADIEKIVLQGITVLAPDLPGTGETGPGNLKGDAYLGNVSHNIWYASMLTGRSLTGLWAGDLVRLARVIKSENKEAQITGLAKKGMTPVLLHAAAFCNDIDRIVLLEPCTSWMSVVTTRLYDPVLPMTAVPGALKKYDLPDLAASLAPRNLVIVNPLDAEGKTDDTDRISKDMKIVREGYHSRSADGNLIIIQGFSGTPGDMRF